MNHQRFIGSHDDLNPPTPSFPAPQTPTFGSNHNAPFLFQSPTPQTPHTHPWAPPPNFSPTRAFPQPQFQELKDVDMSELSPPQPEETGTEGGRTVATGALRRVFKSRERARSKNRLAVARQTQAGSGTDSEDDDDLLIPHTQNTSNHYTLNLPSAPAPQSDTPYILLGSVFF